MRVLKVPIGLAPFKEHPVTNVNQNEGIYDVVNVMEEKPADFISDGSFNLEQYQRCLLYKLITLNKSSIKPFLQHQCSLLEDPFVWLNKLEKLIDLNREVFNTKEQNIRIDKALMVIELLRQEAETNKGKSKYDFNKVKQHLKTYASSEEQLCYLMELKTEYLQNKPTLIDTNEVPFDEKINLEIELIKGQSKIKRKRQTPSVLRNETSVNKREKLKINTNVNQFVDVFYQLSQEKKVNGKPYLEAASHAIAELIAAHFSDKDGNDIPLGTIKTILKPSRFEKRPKEGVRINV